MKSVSAARRQYQRKIDPMGNIKARASANFRFAVAAPSFTERMGAVAKFRLACVSRPGGNKLGYDGRPGCVSRYCNRGGCHIHAKN
jgi:hypothetical protein